MKSQPPVKVPLDSDESSSNNSDQLFFEDPRDRNTGTDDENGTNRVHQRFTQSEQEEEDLLHSIETSEV